MTEIKVRDEGGYSGWEEVDEALREGNPSGYKLAVIEAEKVLQRAIRDLGAGGISPDERVLRVRDQLSDQSGLERARRIRREIVEAEEYRLSTAEVEDAIQAYRRAVDDLKEQTGGHPRILLRMIGLLRYRLPGRAYAWRKAVVLLVLASLLILFLADTEPGRVLGEKTVEALHFFYRWVLVVLLTFGGVAAVVVLAILYLRRRRFRRENHRENG